MYILLYYVFFSLSLSLSLYMCVHMSIPSTIQAQTCRALARNPRSNLSFYFVAEVLQA